LESFKANRWFELYEDSEQYLISEELPYLDNDEWIFTWNAMHTDQSDPMPDKNLILKEQAFVE